MLQYITVSIGLYVTTLFFESIHGLHTVSSERVGVLSLDGDVNKHSRFTLPIHTLPAS